MPPATRPRANNQRETILDAAERVAAGKGAANLTLDAVAAEAKVGKGGLMYHFPSKQALLEGLIGRVRELYAERVQAAATQPDKQLLAHLATLSGRDQRLDRLATALLAVGVNAPELLSPLSEQQQRLNAHRLRQGAAGEEEALLFLATNGLYLLERLGIEPFTPEDRATLIAAIARRANG